MTSTELRTGQSHRQRLCNICTAGFAVTMMVTAAPASAEGWNLALAGTEGLSYSNGNYDTDHNISVEMALTTLTLEATDFKLSASLPYMRISGRGLVSFDAAGNPILINRRSTISPTIRTGFSDLNFAASYAVPPALLDEFDVQITARLKLPTAPTRRRLSTGLADFGMDLDVSKKIGNWGPFLEIGYLLPGKPSGFDLYNTVSMSAGSSLQLTENFVAIASYDYDSQSSRLVRSSQNLFVSLSWLANDRITLTAYGTKGLSSGSPDIGLGLLTSYAAD